MERAFELEKFLVPENHVRSNFYSDTFRAKFAIGGEMGEWDITYIHIPFTQEKEQAAMRRFGLRKEDMDTFYHRLLRCIKNDLDIFRYIVNALNQDEEQETGSLRRSCVMYIHDNGRMLKDDEGREVREIVRVSKPYRSLWESGYAEKDGTIRLSKVLELQIRILQIIRQLNLIGVHLGAIDLDAMLVAEDSDPNRPTLALGSFMYAYRDDTQQLQDYPACTPKNIFPSLLDSKELAPTYDTDLFSWAALSCALMTGGWWDKMPDLSAYPTYMPEELLDATWNGFGFEAEKFLQPINKEYNRYWRLVRKNPDKDARIPLSLDPKIGAELAVPFANAQDPTVPANAPEDVGKSTEVEEHTGAGAASPIDHVILPVPDEPENLATEAGEQVVAETHPAGNPVQTPQTEEAASEAQDVEAGSVATEPPSVQPVADTQIEHQESDQQREETQIDLPADEIDPPVEQTEQETLQSEGDAQRAEQQESCFVFETVFLDEEEAEKRAVLHQGWCGNERPPFLPSESDISCSDDGSAHCEVEKAESVCLEPPDENGEKDKGGLSESECREFALDPAVEEAARSISKRHLPFMAFCPENEADQTAFVEQILRIMGEDYAVVGDGPMHTFLYMGVEGHPMPTPSCEMHERKEVKLYEEKPCTEDSEGDAEADKERPEADEACAAGVPQDPPVDEVMAPCENMPGIDAEESGDPYIGCNGRWWNGDIDTGVEAGPDARYESQLTDVPAPDASDAQEVVPVMEEENPVNEPATEDATTPDVSAPNDPAGGGECSEIGGCEAADDAAVHSDDVAPENDQQAAEEAESVTKTAADDLSNVDALTWDPFAFVAPGTGDIEIPAFKEPEQPKEKHESEPVSKDPFAFIDEDSFFCFTQVNLQ